MENKLSREDFEKYVDIVIGRWPDMVEVDEKELFYTGGARIPALVAVKDKIEDSDWGIETSDETDRILYSINWSVYTILHEIARRSLVVRPRDIDRNFLLHQFKDQTRFIIK